MASTSTDKRKGKSPEKPCRKKPRLCFEEEDNESLTCVICLEIIKNKSFANNCLHKFCFECLLKWSEQRAECPLCNGPFTAIIHNVKSDQEYDEHIIVGCPTFRPSHSGPDVPITSEEVNSYLSSIGNLFLDSDTSDSSTSGSSTSGSSTSGSSTSGSSTSDSSTSDSSTSDSNGEDDL